MTRSKLKLFCLAVALMAPAMVHAQDSLAAVLAAKRGDAAGVRDQIRKSGLSPDQIRAKLKASGMKESALDSYFASAAGATGTSEAPPNADVMAAVAVLGNADQIAQNAATARPVNEVPTGPTTIGGLPVFGLSLFRKNTNQFEPNAVGPVDANYRLGPLDVVALILTGETELSHSLEVTRDGFIVIPQVGQVFVANLTLGQATQAIVQKLRQSYSGAGTNDGARTKVYVTVARLRSNQVFVIGDVSSPGSYQVSAAGTVLSALYAAGGPTINGSMRTVEIRRAGHVVSTVDLYEYLLRGDASRDMRLESGDIIFVPANPKQVAITGEIVRPAVYEMKDGETLEQLIAYAGGERTTAARARVQINRIVPPAERQPGGRDRTVIDVVGDPQVAGSAASRVALQPRDSVTVFPIAERVRNRLTVTGNVWSPGAVALRPGLKLSDAITLVGGLKPDTYFPEVQINRLLPDDQREQVRVALDTLGRPVVDLELRDDDQVQVFSNSDFRTVRNVKLVGAVRKPVDIPWRRGISVADLVLLGGGFESDSDVLDSVSVSRLQSDLSRRSFSVGLRDNRNALTTIPLEAGDSLRMFTRSQFRPSRVIHVSGAVRNPTELPYAEGMTLRQALLAAGGLEESALLSEVQIARLPDRQQAGKLADIITVSLDSTYVFERGRDGKYIGPQGIPAPAGSAADVILKPFDQINVKHQPEWDLGGSVNLGGEVRYPGTYALLRRDETVKDIIDRAGGLTDRAYLPAAIFTRPVSLADAETRRRLLEKVRLDRTYGMAAERLTSSISTSTSLSATTTDVATPANKALADVLATTDSATERVAINLRNALREPRSGDNLVVRPGDRLVIPIMNPTVTIRGFVGAPTTVAYQDGLSLHDYINLAGGPTRNGDVRLAFVHQPNGAVETYRVRRFRPDDEPSPLPGSVIVVPPAELQVRNESVFQSLTALASLATAAAAIISVSRR